MALRITAKASLSLDETDRQVLATFYPGVRANDWARQVLRDELRRLHLQRLAEAIASLDERRQ